MTDVVDVTVELSHPFNAEDRAYRIGDQVVKVKTWHDPAISQLGREGFRMTAALCDATGAALRDARGEPQVVRAEYQYYAGVEAAEIEGFDPVQKLEEARRDCARSALAAQRNRDALLAAPGVASSLALTAQPLALTHGTPR